MGGLWEALFDITEYTCCRLNIPLSLLFNAILDEYRGFCFVYDSIPKERMTGNLPSHLHLLISFSLIPLWQLNVPSCFASLLPPSLCCVLVVFCPVFEPFQCQ